jgi:hypothetical protein
LYYCGCTFERPSEYSASESLDGTTTDGGDDGDESVANDLDRLGCSKTVVN